MIRQSKIAVRYEHPAKIPSHNCGRCVYFQSPDACEKVRGKIARPDWCKLWKPK